VVGEEELDGVAGYTARHILSTEKLGTRIACTTDAYFAAIANVQAGGMGQDGTVGTLLR
jgi:hypothetical protein